MFDSFGTSLRSSQRQASPSTSEELSYSSEEEGKNYQMDQSQAPPFEHGGRQTGVKGVQADAKFQAQQDAAKRANDVEQHNARMQSLALGTNRTWKEDEEERKRESEAGVKPGERITNNNDSDEDELEEIRKRRLQNLKSQQAANELRRRRMAGEDVGSFQFSRAGGGGGNAAFGHLREVGPDQYAQAIDGENSNTFVVVHIYVKYVHSCAVLTSALSTLARVHPKIKFIQIRAGSIAFGSGGVKGHQSLTTTATNTNDDDLDDLDEDDFDERAEDIVPTLLVYRGGNVVANLVRVDLDEGWGDGSERNIAEILRSHKVLS